MSVSEFPSVALVREAASQVYLRRRVLYPAIIFPILGLLALHLLTRTYVTSVTSLASIIMLDLASTPFYVVLATTCHRVILLGDSSIPNRFGLYWSRQETLFLGRLVILGLITIAIVGPIWALLLVLPLSIFDGEGIYFLFSLSAIAMAYIDGRFSLILPATAVGRLTSLRASWNMSKGMGWHIAIALLIPLFSLDLIDYIIFDLLIATDSPFVEFFWGLMTFPLFALFIAIITVAYRDLSAKADDRFTSSESPRRPI